MKITTTACALIAFAGNAAAQTIDETTIAERAIVCENITDSEAMTQCVSDVMFLLRIEAARCTEIQDAANRVACYDSAANRPVATTPAPQSEWIARIETSEMTDQTNVFLRVESENYVSCGFSGRSKPVLHLRCMENTTAVIITTSCFLSDIQGYGNVTYRLDDQAAQTKGFSASTNNNALGLWNGSSAIPFIKNMLGHDTILTRFTPFSDSAVSPRFPIAGLNEEIGPLRAACGW